jgi:hypothetical protein
MSAIEGKREMKLLFKVARGLNLNLLKGPISKPDEDSGESRYSAFTEMDHIMSLNKEYSDQTATVLPPRSSEKESGPEHRDFHSLENSKSDQDEDQSLSVAEEKEVRGNADKSQEDQPEDKDAFKTSPPLTALMEKEQHQMVVNHPTGSTGAAEPGEDQAGHGNANAVTESWVHVKASSFKPHERQVTGAGLLPVFDSLRNETQKTSQQPLSHHEIEDASLISKMSATTATENRPAEGASKPLHLKESESHVNKKEGSGNNTNTRAPAPAMKQKQRGGPAENKIPAGPLPDKVEQKQLTAKGKKQQPRDTTLFSEKVQSITGQGPQGAAVAASRSNHIERPLGVKARTGGSVSIGRVHIQVHKKQRQEEGWPVPPSYTSHVIKEDWEWSCHYGH